MKCERVIIPASLQQEYLKELYKEHQGMEATKHRAHETVYWPDINTDIEEATAR